MLTLGQITNDQKLDTLGKIKVNLTYEGETNPETVYVVGNLRLPILGINEEIRFGVLNFSIKNVCLTSDYNFDVR